MIPQVSFGTATFNTASGYARLVGTPWINMRIAGRSTAGCSVMADSGTVAPSTFAIGTPCNIVNFTNQPANDAIEFLSSDADDISKEILFIGVDTGGTVRYEAIDTHAGDGRTVVTTSRSDWQELYEVHVPAGMIGTLTVREASGNATITTVPVGTRFVSDRLFSGFLETVKISKVVETAAAANMRYDCDFVDVGQVLDRRLCLEDFAAKNVGQIIDTLLTNYLTAEGFVRTWGNVDRIHPTVAAVTVANLNAAYKPISEVLNELARIAGCSWWVTPYRVLYMAAEGDNTIPAPVTVSESVAVSNLSVETTKGQYRNIERFVYEMIDAADTTELKTPDDQTTSWATARRVYDLTSVHLSASSRRVGPSGDGKYTVIADEETGGAFVAVPTSPPVAVTIQSTNPEDSRNVTVYGISTPDATLLSVSTKALNGTTPVTMDNFLYAVVGVRVASSVAAVDVVVKWAPLGDPTTICTLADGAETAGIFVPADVDTEYFVKPTVWVDQDGLSETWVGIREVTDSSTVYRAVKVTGADAANFAVECGALKEIYIGAVQDNVTVKCEAEYQYARGQIGVRASSLADAPDATTYPTMTVVYTGMEEGLYLAQDAGEIAAMLALEGSGTGQYEHATILKEPVLATEATARAAALLAKYGAFPKALSFDTYIPWWFPGQLVTASLATDYGENATEFVVTEVELRESDQPGTDDYKWQYHITAQSGEDYSAFDRLEIYRQLRARQPYVATENLTT